MMIPHKHRLLEVALERADFARCLAPEGEADIARATEARSSVFAALLELTMPGMSGMETPEHLAAPRGGRSRPTANAWSA